MQLTLIPVEMIEDDSWFDGSEGGLKLTPVALAEDGWDSGPVVQPRERLSDIREVSMYPGDLVLYRCEGKLVPAALIELAANGCWLARDSRHGRSFIHPGPRGDRDALAAAGLISKGRDEGPRQSLVFRWRRHALGRAAPVGQPDRFFPYPA